MELHVASKLSVMEETRGEKRGERKGIVDDIIESGPGRERDRSDEIHDKP